MKRISLHTLWHWRQLTVLAYVPIDRMFHWLYCQNDIFQWARFKPETQLEQPTLGWTIATGMQFVFSRLQHLLLGSCISSATYIESWVSGPLATDTCTRFCRPIQVLFYFNFAFGWPSYFLIPSVTLGEWWRPKRLPAKHGIDVPSKTSHDCPTFLFLISSYSN